MAGKTIALTAKPTIKDVARHAGAALGTVSRVLNGHPSVKPSVRAKVERAMRDLGYAPDTVAQSMRRGVTQTVGVIVRDIAVSQLADFVKAAQDTLEPMGLALLIACSEDRKERELQLLDLFARRRVDGLITTTLSEEDPEIKAAHANFPAPIVFLDREPPTSADTTLISHREGVRQAADYLLGLGHCRIALITGTNEILSVRERVAGYHEAFIARGVKPDPGLIRRAAFNTDAGLEQGSALLRLAARPTAIIAGGFNILPGLLRAVQTRRLRIPQDVSIIGSGDSDLARLASPAVTVIQWDMPAVGRAAAQLLLERMVEKREVAARVVMPAELLIRASCAAPPAEAPPIKLA